MREFVFGLAVAAPFGPIASLLISAGLNLSLAGALVRALGVAVADLTYALVALTTGAGVGAMLRGHDPLLKRGSSGLLLVIAVWLLWSALTPRAKRRPARGTSSHARGFAGFYLLTLANPLTILLFLGLAGQMSPERGAGAIIPAALFLFLGSLTVQCAYAGFGSALGRVLEKGSGKRVLNVVSALTIAAFGLYGLLKNL